MAERKFVMSRVSGEYVADVCAGRERMCLRKDAHASDKDETADGEKESRRASTSATFAAIGGGIVFALKPAGREQGESWNGGERIIFLAA